MGKIRGLGDLIEWILRRLWITEERIKKLLDIEECGCHSRKDFLNKLWSWKSNKKREDEPPSSE